MNRRYTAAAAGTAALMLTLAGCSSPEGSAEDSAETRTIEHAAGTSVVPVDPQRIVTTTDQNALLPLLELGVVPVGSAGLLGEDGSMTFRRTTGFDTSGIEFTGNYGEPNLEKVASLNPDLIVGFEYDDTFYDDLSGIAPTVLVSVFGQPLPDALMDFAAAVGKTAEAEELRADYEQSIADLKDKLAEKLDTLSVTIIYVSEPGIFHRVDSGQAMGSVMDDLGILRVEAQAADVSDEAPVSIEELPQRDADVVLVVDFSDELDDAATKEFMATDLFQNLAATQAGQSQVIDGLTVVGAGWSRMEAFVDTLEEILVDADPDVVSE